MIHITDFGGLVPRLTHFNTKPNMAEIAENINLERGTLKPFRTPKKISDKTGQSLYVHNYNLGGCCVNTGACHENFTYFGFGQDEITVNTGLYPYPTYSTECEQWQKLGFTCNLSKPIANTVEEVTEDFTLEDRSYYYTLVNKMGWESQPSYPSKAIQCNTGKTVIVTNIADNVTDDYEYINIYRTVNQLDYGVKQQDSVSAEYLYVGSIAKGEHSFTDNTLIGGDVCPSEEYDPPPNDLHSIDMWREGRLVGLSKNCFVMTERNLPHAWNRKYHITFDECQAKRVIATDKKAYILTDGKPFVISLNGECEDKSQAVTINDTLEPLPIISRQSAVKYMGSVVYASTDGLILLDGVNAKLLTEEYYTAKQWQALHPHTMKGAIHEGYYYGVTDKTFIRFKLPSPIYNTQAEKCLTTLSLRPTALHTSVKGRLYLSLADGIYEWEQGDDYLPMTWKSKTLTQAGITHFGAFKLVTANHGNQIQHFMDKRQIQDYQHKHNKPVRLPIGYKGINWQVQISGKNEVYEYHLAPSIRELASA
ncbi:MAG: hypothetical protein KGV51_00935 [Moraxellaceae bacterium]|nr:hypothetical protein [Moraxellaceae bacterium]